MIGQQRNGLLFGFSDLDSSRSEVVLVSICGPIAMGIACIRRCRRRRWVAALCVVLMMIDLAHQALLFPGNTVLQVGAICDLFGVEIVCNKI